MSSKTWKCIGLGLVVGGVVAGICAFGLSSTILALMAGGMIGGGLGSFLVS